MLLVKTGIERAAVRRSRAPTKAWEAFVAAPDEEQSDETHAYDRPILNTSVPNQSYE